MIYNIIIIIGFPGDVSGKEPTYQCRRLKRHGFDPWVRETPGGGHGSPPQDSYLENPMDRGAWKAMVHSVTKSQTQLRLLSMDEHSSGWKFTHRYGYILVCRGICVVCKRTLSLHTHIPFSKMLSGGSSSDSNWETPTCPPAVSSESSGVNRTCRDNTAKGRCMTPQWPHLSVQPWGQNVSSPLHWAQNPWLKCKVRMANSRS